jgi:hypothetical protein
MRPSMFAFALVVVPGVTHATEEPDHEVLRRLDSNIEIRQYKPYVVAEVLVEGSADTAGNDAFPILAGYIFGKNKGERSFSMTAPVTQSAAPVKLEMTAPVTQTAAAGGWIVRFVLPRVVTLASAPEPNDSRVKLREVATSPIAAIRYSGFWSAGNYAEHLDKLKATLTSEGLAWSGEPVFSRYNPPFTPWFLRRNEIWLFLSSPQVKPE